MPTPRRFSLALPLLLLVAACGGAAAPSQTPAPTTPSPTVAATPASAGLWVVTDESAATVRVREQLVGVSAPSDAVLVAKGAKGSFSLKSDGTFGAESMISFDLTTLASDSRGRDQRVKRDPLETQKFPAAEFVPTTTSGLMLPLANGGEFTFTLTGKMTIHGTTKEVTFDVTAKRAGGDLTATATAKPAWKFADFGMELPSSPLRVVSVVDEIKVTIDLVAKLAP